MQIITQRQQPKKKFLCKVIYKRNSNYQIDIWKILNFSGSHVSKKILNLILKNVKQGMRGNLTF